MADGGSLEHSMKNLLASPGGQMVNDASSFLRRQAKLLIFLFLLSVIIGFSLTKSVVTWLIADERLPNDVNIIVTSPIEFILLQFQIAVSFGLAIISSYLILALIISGRNNSAVAARLAELNLRPPNFSLAIITSFFAILGLAAIGLLYSWEFLTPMILQYLTDDAQNAGLSTEWRLSGYVGFIVNLALACVIGFQAPVVTILCLRMGIASRYQIIQYRRHIWFTAFILGAFLSPPDPLSLFLVAMPVVILFETAIFLDRIIKFSNA